MVLQICVIVFMAATLINWVLVYKRLSQLERDTYTMFINYSKALEAVKVDVRLVQQNGIEPLEKSQEQTDKRLDDIAGKLNAHDEDIDELNKMIFQLRECVTELESQMEEYAEPAEEGSPEADLIRGLQNIFNFSGGSQ